MPYKPPTHKPLSSNVPPRPSAAKRGYDARWRKRRLAFLRLHPLCEDHLEKGELVPATEPHHKIPRAQGGSDDFDNLVALCKPCHSKRTIKENRGS